jgi:hypothetical protein
MRPLFDSTWSHSFARQCRSSRVHDLATQYSSSMKRADGAEMSIIYAGCVSVIVLALLGILAFREEIINELRSRSH